MSSRRPATRYLPALLGLGLASMLVTGRAAGQLQTADPYDPYGASYRGSTYPGYVRDPSLLNRPVYRPGPNVNQLEEFYRGLDGGGDFGDASNRYDQRFRDYSDMIGRNPSLDNDAETKFFKARFRRDELFFEIQREKDPKKKAELTAELKKVTAEVNKNYARRPTGRAASTPPPAVRDRTARGASASSSTTPKPFVLPSFASFRPVERPFVPPASLPSLPLARNQTAPPDPDATTDGSRRPAPNNSPSAVLERADRSQSRRPAPPIPGLEDSPR